MRNLIFVKSCLHLAFLALLCAVPQSASAVEWSADFVLPQLAQRGTMVTVRIQGSGLQTAEEVLFYREGIRCTAIRQLDTVPHSHNGTPLKVEPGKAIELDFEIAPDAPLGEYYLRLRTKQKLSEMLSFWVTQFPVVPEEHAFVDTGETRNDSPQYAQRIPLNCTVSGLGCSNERANDWDVYRVALTEHQRCTCQIISARLGTVHAGGLTDMAIEVRSPSGKRVARNNRSALFVHDPVVSFIAPEAGDYLITVGQQMDSEIRNIHYGLHIGDFPRPAITFPLGGQLGDELDLDVFYLDGSRGKLKAKLPNEVAAFENSMVELTTITDMPEIPSPNRFQVAAFPSVYEVEGHSRPENAQTIDQPLPVSLNGIIRTEGEKDWYRFSAKKGERYRVRVYAQTLGSKLDPFVWIKPAEGNPSRRVYEQDDSLWDGHDWEGHHYRHQVKDRLDPVFMFEPDEDGDYLLGIADTRREWGDDYVYRVELQPHHDSVFLYYKDYPVQYTIMRDAIGVHRGATQTRPFAIMNGFGSQYDGPIRLEARGLPPGVDFDSPIFTKNDPVIMATFRAPADAKLQTALLELIPHAVDENVNLLGAVAQTHASNAQRGGYSPLFNKTRKLGFAILEEAPFDISIDEPGIGLAKNAELDLKVNVRRKGDFTGAVYLEMDWLPQGVTKQPPLIIPEGEDVGYYKISATSQTVTGNYRLTITARENEGGDPFTGVGFHYIGSPFISVEVMEPYLQIELQRAAVEQGKRGELVGKIRHLRKFSGVATARLLRLPNGVSLIEEPAIKYGQESVVFPLKIEADALTGQYKEIACDVKITDEGQDIHQQSGSGVIRVDEKKGS
ncbi:MAG: hypothetical protein L7U72_14850 [Rubripirellula sp.]|nr:hypothetical protein [Rubripirellula sp.]